MESVAQRWEALYRKSAERIKEMEQCIRSLEQEVQDWKRQAELWKSMCASPPRRRVPPGGAREDAEGMLRRPHLLVQALRDDA